MVVLRSRSFFGVAESTGSEGKGAHGEAFRAYSVDDGALSGSKLSLVSRADTG